MQKIFIFMKKHGFLVLLFLFSMVMLAATLKINFFRYSNFDYGKFDLGNMTQMVWNAGQGRGLYLTDYFGTNLPRWAMSHVDPVLYLFVPIFKLFPHAMTLVVSQLILVIFSSFLVYAIAKLHLQSKFAAFLLATAYLVNPSIGYITAWSGFHGVTAVIPFFLAAFYIFEKNYRKNTLNKNSLILFWVFLIITMMGKEQVPLYIFMFGVFIILLRNEENPDLKSMLSSKTGKLGSSMILVSAVWFFLSFFVIIPAYSSYRVEGYLKFAESLGIQGSTVRDVALPNYFLNRYEEFGDSYLEIAKNIVLMPDRSVSVFFGGDKVENFRRTFEPLAFLPFAHPLALAMAFPDLIINFMTSAGGIGTAEITNHRISMIIPVLFIATILTIGYFSNIFRKYIKKKHTVVVFSLLVFVFSLTTMHYYNNPVYLWLSQAFQKRIVSRVFAKTDKGIIKKDLTTGEVVRLTELEDKDRECALKIVKMIPDGASVSGSDSFGAHLAKRETYAIFPALYNEADYLIIDVFARKITTILDIDVEIIRDVVEKVIKSEDYELKIGCGNFFVFEKVGPHDKETLLPIQEIFRYDGKFDYEFFQGVNVVDYEIPKVFEKGISKKIDIVYHRWGSGSKKDTSLEDYLMFTSFVNRETGEVYQLANLPSFSLKRPEEWEKNRYYFESVEVVAPEFLDSGEYLLFVGMGNKIRTRSMYLGTVTVN